MFNRKFRLMVQMVGLVAVLVLALALPGVMQENPLSRQNVVNAVSRAIAATLTAAEGDIFDTDAAKFYSDAPVAFAYIPLHPASRSLQFLEENLHKLRTDEDLNVTVGAFYIPEDIPRFLKAGAYTIKLVNRFKAVFVNQEGQEVFSAKVKVERTEGKLEPRAWRLTVSNLPSPSKDLMTLNFGPSILWHILSCCTIEIQPPPW